MKRPWSEAMVVMFVAVVIAGASAGSMSAEAAEAHDLVILNGRVMDPETRFGRSEIQNSLMRQYAKEVER